MKTITITIETPRDMRTLRERIADRLHPPIPACPYCGTVDPKPSTHIAEGRCKA
jgi:hypothetical protein